MKEKLERFGNSFKSGVMIWILSYLVLAGIGTVLGTSLVYNAEIIKLTDPINFISQILIAGITYFVLETVLLDFVDKMLKVADKKEGNDLVKTLIFYIVVIAILCVALYIVKECEIISKYVMKIMMLIIVIQCTIFEFKQLINNARFNKKLKEKNKSE